MFAEIFITAATAIAVYMLVFWFVSIARSNVSIVDIAWGIGFVIVAWVVHLNAEHSNTRSTIQLTFATIWGLRLGAYLLNRNWGEPEDYRYAAMRRRVGPSYTYKSIYMVFGLQGTLMLVVSLPLMAVQGLPSTAPFGLIDWLATAMVVVGFYFEAMGDHQLTRFKADPNNEGRVMDQGVWAWTRHPNYFGDALQWWGFWVFAISVPGAAWTVIGPIVMTVLLIRISGVHLLERGLRKRKPDYEAYIARTPAFIPRPPRSAN
jgi:steroid 5-alpha reductase family enzyme